MAFFTMTKVLLCTTSLSLLLTTPASSQRSSYLISGERLNTGEALVEGIYQFYIQNDCDLVLYQFRTLLWHSGTNNQGVGCYFTLQGNGNLVIFDNRNNIVWRRGINSPNGNYILILQRDRNIVVYGPVVWSSGTNTYGSNDVVVTTTLNGTTGVSSEDQNNVREMGKIMELIE